MYSEKPKKQGCLDQIGVAIFLVVAPLILSYGAIASMSTRDQFAVFASWLLIPIALVLFFVYRRKMQAAWARGAILVLSLAFLALPILTNLVSWNYISHCADRAGPQAVLRHCDFTGAVFDGQDLSLTDLTEATLNNASFRNANLSGVNFTHAYLNGTDFTGAVLEQAVFDWTDLRSTLGLTPAALHSLASWNEVQTGETLEETMQIMAAVCQGQGYRDAKPYTPASIQAGELAATVFAVGDSRDLEINGYLGGMNELSHWQESTAVFTQLTLCFSSAPTVLETCYYSGGNVIPRTEWNVQVELRATLTGEIVSSRFFSAETPKACPKRIKISGTPSPGDWSPNGYVDFAEVRDWVDAGLPASP